MPMKHALIPIVLLCAFSARCMTTSVTSPDGRISATISDVGGLHYEVVVDGQKLLASSKLGLEFGDGTILGPKSGISSSSSGKFDSTWKNRFGKESLVRNHYRELSVSLDESGEQVRKFGLMVRAYDDGVALRYVLPEESGLGNFTLKKDLTTFEFTDDFPCWAGQFSNHGENQYPQTRLSALPAGPGVVPFLVQASNVYVALTEADLRDWAGCYLGGGGMADPHGVTVILAERQDGKGAVVSSTPRVSPWRVIMIGRKPGDLFESCLIENLSTPSQIKDSTWIKPGICAWDPWWHGVHYDAAASGSDVRGTTASDKLYIDFASEMGWAYQLIDWGWYDDKTGDVTKLNGSVDVPGLVAYAKSKGVREFLWMHHNDFNKTGMERSLDFAKSVGAAGVKVDFMDSSSQETVEWYEKVLKLAAERKLLVNFHGAYPPTGLARTWPNFITQEGVLGNEYNKFSTKCDLQHTITLPFTRALLGPMDFTPGGFLNRPASVWKQTSPTEVMGTRARQLAMTVIYPSPLLTMCDSPSNYCNQPGIEFFRGLPTVWDGTKVLSAEVGKYIVVARRSGDRWYLAAMNGPDAVTLEVALSMLADGNWKIQRYADAADSDMHAEKIAIDAVPLPADKTLKIQLAPGGGWAAVAIPE